MVSNLVNTINIILICVMSEQRRNTFHEQARSLNSIQLQSYLSHSLSLNYIYYLRVFSAIELFFNQEFNR